MSGAVAVVVVMGEVMRRVVAGKDFIWIGVSAKNKCFVTTCTAYIIFFPTFPVRCSHEASAI